MSTGRSPYWHGVLCEETLAEIADRMSTVLAGRYFTFVSCNSFDETSDRYSAVDVYGSQWLSSPVAQRDDRDGWWGLSWAMPRLSMGVHTRAKTRADGHAGKPHDWVRFTFERDEIRIEHYAPARYLLLWIFSVEHHDPEDPFVRAEGAGS